MIGRLNFCSGCKKDLLATEFGTRSRGKFSRLQSKCKKCLYLYQQIRWNKQKIRAIDMFGGKCFHCKRSFHPALFDFHHKAGEDKEHIWDYLRRKSWDKIVKELTKCILLCAHCHRLNHVRAELWPGWRDSNPQPSL